MLNLEEYIGKRKREDHLDEFDVTQKMSNIRTSIDYVFEYYDQYLPLEGAESHTAAENERLNKYEKSLREYSPNLRNWLVSIYDDTGHQVNKTIQKYCDNVSGFLLAYEDGEFRNISYGCYAELVKKRPCLKNQTENLFQFLKEYHDVITKREYEYFGFPQISEKISNWLNTTYEKYNVNIAAAIQHYLMDEFWNNLDLWPPGTKIKSDMPYKGHPYDYNYKKRVNLFNINGFYSKFGNKPFLKGKKKMLEILMMVTWLGGIDGDDPEFLQEYLVEFKDY